MILTSYLLNLEFLGFILHKIISGFLGVGTLKADKIKALPDLVIWEYYILMHLYFDSPLLILS